MARQMDVLERVIPPPDADLFAARSALLTDGRSTKERILIMAIHRGLISEPKTVPPDNTFVLPRSYIAILSG